MDLLQVVREEQSQQRVEKGEGADEEETKGRGCDRKSRTDKVQEVTPYIMKSSFQALHHITPSSADQPLS